MGEFNIHDMPSQNINEVRDNDEFERKIAADETAFEEFAANIDIEDERTAKFKKQRKVNAISLLVSTGIAAVPFVQKSIRAKKDGLTYKPNKYEIAAAINNVLVPTIKVTDDLVNKGRLQEKTGNILTHVNNVSNILNLYPEVYGVVNNMAIKNKQRNKVNRRDTHYTLEPQHEVSKLSLVLKTANLLTPYVTDTLCEKDTTVMEKISNLMPIQGIGFLVQKFAYSNTKTARAYEAVRSTLVTGSNITKMIGGPVRQSNRGGTVDKGITGFLSGLDNLGKLMGVNNLNQQGYYNNYGGGNGFYQNHNNYNYNNNYGNGFGGLS